MYLLAGELPAGPGDTLLGEVAGAPVYTDDCHFVTVPPRAEAALHGARRRREA